MFTRPVATSSVASSLFAQEEPKLCLPPLVPSYPTRQLASVALASGLNQTADLPGPSAGYIRLYDSVQITPDALASGLTAPAAYLRSGGTNYLIKVGANITATTSVANVPALGVDEVIRVINGGNNAGRVVGTYVDIPATGITLLRTVLDATGVEILPTAPTGYSVRFLQTTAGQPAVVISNRDAVDQSFDVLLGSTVLTRSAPVTAGTVGVLADPTLIPVTDTALKVRCDAAVNTTAPVLLGAYEICPVA